MVVEVEHVAARTWWWGVGPAWWAAKQDFWGRTYSMAKELRLVRDVKEDRWTILVVLPFILPIRGAG